MYPKPILVTACYVALTSFAAAADCNFDKPIGGCRATISIDSISGSKGSYSAEVTVKSSAGACSKVEYFLDNTPQTTVIRSGSSEPESLFGTKPITKKSILIRKCTSYANANAGKDNAGDVAIGPEFFEGRWQGSVGMLLLRAGLVLDLSVDGNQVRGTSTAQNSGEVVQVNGIVSGGVLTYTYEQPADGRPASVRITRKSANSISYSGSAGGVTLSGTLQRL
ncbi:hypothetical protein AM571_CH02440 [Rhizobium etli 8C-3]|uniref:Uncharacterized protein n=1 Tax=Rhizobium etli 8C-3 TaxID=538025 RepID=A0A1L5P538_RHIET|nr:hypothetical protein [Rhizobium etli]APO75249.1 hypothetical protein AM571_CH02440 [Rhizobium etli 8C-3]